MWVSKFLGLSLLFWVVIAIISIVIIRHMTKIMRKLSNSRYIVDRKTRLKLKPIFRRIIILLVFVNLISLMVPIFFIIQL